QRHTGKFIIPIFGFTTSRYENIEAPGESRPKRQFISRPYFSGCSDTRTVDLSIRQLDVTCEYSSRGELTIITQGGKMGGFFICSSCGYATQELTKKPGHKNAYGNDCKTYLRGPLQLGHVFTTDILKFIIRRPQMRELNFWYSLLYAILEGMSQSLGVRRQDINGCVYVQNKQPCIVLYDNVPGGASLVKQLIDKENLEMIMRKSLEIVKGCTCGIETSCHGCLRNYENEFCHDRLQRGLVVDFLDEVLK
nr:DUF1998 domain-containing protein [Candidatus Sigynarchaeota archaeon]